MYRVTHIFPEAKPEIKKVLLLLLVAATAALVTNHFSPVGIELIGQWDQSKNGIDADTGDGFPGRQPDIDNIGMAKLIYDSGNAIFVDARSMDFYRQGHIKGAISLPVEDFDRLIDSFFNLNPIDKHIITYCSQRLCEENRRLAHRLLEFGYKSVSIMTDGFPVWKENKFPVE